MKNRYIEHAHISERKFRAILHHFAHDICVLKTSALLGIRRQSVSRIYGLLRQRLLVLSIKEFRPFAGEVEIDESYFGPRRAHGKFGRGTAKVPVLGLHKRGDRVYVSIVKNCSMRELMPVVEGRVLSQSDVYTDTWSAYAGLVKSGYRHHRIRHDRNQFADGKNHINGIESFWSFAKFRMSKLRGMRREHFLLHLKESEWRWNHRFEDIYKKLLSLLRKSPLKRT